MKRALDLAAKIFLICCGYFTLGYILYFTNLNDFKYHKLEFYFYA